MLALARASPSPELWLPGAFCAHCGGPGAGKTLLGRLPACGMLPAPGQCQQPAPLRGRRRCPQKWVFPGSRVCVEVRVLPVSP